MRSVWPWNSAPLPKTLPAPATPTQLVQRPFAKLRLPVVRVPFTLDLRAGLRGL